MIVTTGGMKMALGVLRASYEYRILLACDIVGSDSHNEGGYDGSEITCCVVGSIGMGWMW